MTPRPEPRPREPELVKMAGLARLSGVPAATIKHYLREGLLPPPARQNRNVAYYDPGVADRIRRIKALQRDRFLPLKVIRDILDADALPTRDETMGAAIARVLSDRSGSESRSEAELLASGMPSGELTWLARLGLLSPGEDGLYRGDDLELLRVLGAARRAGIGAEMLPVTILSEYVEAMQRLVRAELRLFREGVLPRAGEDLEGLATAATTLSERLVVLLRRKLLLPTLAELVKAQEPNPKSGATRRARKKRRTS